MVESAEKSMKTPVREASAPPHVQRVDRRLSDQVIAELAQAYAMAPPHLRSDGTTD
jgi:hypothetical protein